jgi:hypothetical protein
MRNEVAACTHESGGWPITQPPDCFATGHAYHTDAHHVLVPAKFSAAAAGPTTAHEHHLLSNLLADLISRMNGHISQQRCATFTHSRVVFAHRELFLGWLVSEEGRHFAVGVKIN